MTCGETPQTAMWSTIPIARAKWNYASPKRETTSASNGTFARIPNALVTTHAGMSRNAHGERFEVLAAGDNGAATRMSAALSQVERAFLNPQGLPGRPWFKHQLIGPGLTTGYAPWPFPALREAVENRDRTMFDAEAKRVIDAINAGAAALRAAAAVK